MKALNRSRSPSAWFSTTFRVSPTFSTSPSGSYSNVRCTDVCPGPTSWNVTSPALVAPSVAAQDTLRSGTCSRIFASQRRRTPAISATHSRRSSLSCVTLVIPPMNWGKSSNCVHWLYAVNTGTLTTTDFSTLVVIGLLRPRGQTLTVHPRSSDHRTARRPVTASGGGPRAAPVDQSDEGSAPAAFPPARDDGVGIDLGGDDGRSVDPATVRVEDPLVQRVDDVPDRG